MFGKILAQINFWVRKFFTQMEEKTRDFSTFCRKYSKPTSVCLSVCIVYALCVIFTILVSFSRDNALFASKAKINVFWNFFEWIGPEGASGVKKKYKNHIYGEKSENKIMKITHSAMLMMMADEYRNAEDGECDFERAQKKKLAWACRFCLWAALSSKTSLKKKSLNPSFTISTRCAPRSPWSTMS